MEISDVELWSFKDKNNALVELLGNEDRGNAAGSLKKNNSNSRLFFVIFFNLLLAKLWKVKMKSIVSLLTIDYFF